MKSKIEEASPDSVHLLLGVLFQVHDLSVCYFFLFSFRSADIVLAEKMNSRGRMNIKVSFFRSEQL